MLVAARRPGDGPTEHSQHPHTCTHAALKLRCGPEWSWAGPNSQPSSGTSLHDLDVPHLAIARVALTTESCLSVVSRRPSASPRARLHLERHRSRLCDRLPRRERAPHEVDRGAGAAQAEEEEERHHARREVVQALRGRPRDAPAKACPCEQGLGERRAASKPRGGGGGGDA